MPKKKTEKTQEKSWIEFPSDNETVIIKGKRYTVNQSSPPFEFCSKYSNLSYSFQHIDEEIQRAYKVVDALNIKLDEAIQNQDIDKIIEIDKLKEAKKTEASNTLLGMINAFYDVIEWLIGSEAVAIIKKETNNIESLIPIFNKICIKNQFFEYAIKQSSK